PQLTRQREKHLLLTAHNFLGHFRPPGAKPLHHLLHQQLRRRRAGGYSDSTLAVEPLTVHIIRPVDQITGNTRTVGELTEAVRVGTGARPYNYDDIALLEKLLDRVLAILGRVADIFLSWRR